MFFYTFPSEFSSYSTHLRFIVNCFVVSDSGENGIQRVTSIVKLISKIMKHVWVNAEELEPSIARIFTIVQRLVLMTVLFRLRKPINPNQQKNILWNFNDDVIIILWIPFAPLTEETWLKLFTKDHGFIHFLFCDGKTRPLFLFQMPKDASFLPPTDLLYASLPVGTFQHCIARWKLAIRLVN